MNEIFLPYLSFFDFQRLDHKDKRKHQLRKIILSESTFANSESIARRQQIPNLVSVWDVITCIIIDNLRDAQGEFADVGVFHDASYAYLIIGNGQRGFTFLGARVN